MQIQCPNCGAMNSKGANFCSFCYKKLDKSKKKNKRNDKDNNSVVQSVQTTSEIDSPFEVKIQPEPEIKKEVVKSEKEDTIPTSGTVATIKENNTPNVSASHTAETTDVVDNMASATLAPSLSEQTVEENVTNTETVESSSSPSLPNVPHKVVPPRVAPPVRPVARPVAKPVVKPVTQEDKPQVTQEEKPEEKKTENISEDVRPQFPVNETQADMVESKNNPANESTNQPSQSEEVSSISKSGFTTGINETENGEMSFVPIQSVQEQSISSSETENSSSASSNSNVNLNEPFVPQSSTDAKKDSSTRPQKKSNGNMFDLVSKTKPKPKTKQKPVVDENYIPPVPDADVTTTSKGFTIVVKKTGSEKYSPADGVVFTKDTAVEANKKKVNYLSKVSYDGYYDDVLPYDFNNEGDVGLSFFDAGKLKKIIPIIAIGLLLIGVSVYMLVFN